MKVQVNTDNQINGSNELDQLIRSEVEHALGHFSDQVTRIEAHLSDQNGHKSGPDDKRCMLEARLAGIQPIAVTHEAPSLVEAIGGAADKLKTAVNNRLGKMGDRRAS